MKPILAAIAVMFVLTGCAAKMTLTDRTDGQSYFGMTEGTSGGNGTVKFTIEGEEYAGTWTYQPNGGGFTMASMRGTSDLSGMATTTTATGRVANTQFSGTGTSVGTASMLTMSAVGNGMANARAASGKFIRCVFTFNSLQNTGLGECQRNDGRTYDMQIKRGGLT